jgi:hypothetical protein
MGSKPSTPRPKRETADPKINVKPQTRSTKAVKSESTFAPHEVPDDVGKPGLDRQDSVSNRDLMISYSHQDKEVMAKLRGKKDLTISHSRQYKKVIAKLRGKKDLTVSYNHQ